MSIAVGMMKINAFASFLAKSPETVDKLEGLVALWAKEIELVLAKSEQVLDS